MENLESMRGRLIKYIAELGTLTLTILLENGKEIIVPIQSVALPSQLAADIEATLDPPPDYQKEKPSIQKITRTFDPTTGAFLTVHEESDNGQSNSGKYTHIMLYLPTTDQE